MSVNDTEYEFFSVLEQMTFRAYAAGMCVFRVTESSLEGKLLMLMMGGAAETIAEYALVEETLERC